MMIVWKGIWSIRLNDMTLPFVLFKYCLSCELVIEQGNVQPLALGQLLGAVIGQPITRQWLLQDH